MSRVQVIGLDVLQGCKGALASGLLAFRFAVFLVLFFAFIVISSVFSFIVINSVFSFIVISSVFSIIVINSVFSFIVISSVFSFIVIFFVPSFAFLLPIIITTRNRLQLVLFAIITVNMDTHSIFNINLTHETVLSRVLHLFAQRCT